MLVRAGNQILRSMYLWFARVQLLLCSSVITGNNSVSSYFFLLREVRLSSLVKQMQHLAL